MRIAVALGGNSLVRHGQKGTYGEQIENMRVTCEQLAKLVKAGHSLVIIHGNGPQVGNILLQQESTEEVPKMPLDVCVAMTQSEIGYFIQKLLGNELEKLSIKRDMITVVTQVIVDPGDPAFKNPTKPIGPYYDEKKFGDMVYVEGKGYRRVVPSPRPVEIVERDTIKKLFDSGFIVIAGGGGGIPVVRKKAALVGAEAVVDKDFCAEMIAEIVNADVLLVLTDVDGVTINYKRPGERKLDRMSVEEAEKYAREGQFGEGRMKPKIEACVKFIRNGGRKCIVSLPENVVDALVGRAGTLISE